MTNDLIVPELRLIDKLEEMETTLAPAVWEQMRNEVAVYHPYEEKLPVEKLNHTTFEEFIK